MARYNVRRPSSDDVSALASRPTERIKERYPNSERYARRMSELVREGAMAARESEQYHQLGDKMIDSVAQAFPEEYQARRRSLMIQSFAAGAAVGAISVGYLARRFRSE